MVSRFTIEVSGDSSKVIQEWIKEVNLHGGTGKLLSVGKACELVIEDFATTMKGDEGDDEE